MTRTTGISTDPRTWLDEAEEALVDGRDFLRPGSQHASAANGIVVGSTGRLAVRAGAKALQAGGTAADAVLTTALTQIALAGGCWVSYAGLSGLVYREGATGTIRSLSAGFAVPRGEHDGATIPRDGTVSGRTTLVPAFMSGVYAAHDAYGVLPWADLFAPAIWVAEEGFVLGAGRSEQIALRAEVLGRWEHTRSIFTKPDGSWLGRGDVLRQPALAQTLRAVASDGVTHMTEGPWARKLVDALRGIGGLMTLDDLASYEPLWSEPLVGSFRGNDVHAFAAPNTGGAMLVESLHLLEEADVRSMDDPAEALYWLIQISRQSHVLSTIPGEVRATREHARRVWTMMRDRGAFVGPGKVRRGTHSDFVVAADAQGNVAALCHTGNVSVWGLTGMFIDGIGIPDAARFQPEVVAMTGPGNHVPNPLNPGIAVRDGRVALAWSTIGAGLAETAMQCVASVLDRSPLADAIDDAPIIAPAPVPGDTVVGGAAPPEQEIPDTDMDDEDADPLGVWRNFLRRLPQGVDAGAFPAEVLDAVRKRGLEIREIDAPGAIGLRGYWGGLVIDEDGTKHAGRTGGVNGGIEGY